MNSHKVMLCKGLQVKVILFAAVVVISQPLVQAAVRGNDWKDLLLTLNEKNALDQFKEKMAPRVPESYMKSDFYLIRWLRAKYLNIPAAQNMLNENLKWREVNRMKEILTEDWSDMKEDFPLTISNHDRQGRPVATLEMGDWDLRSAVLQGRMPRLLRYMDWYQEEIIRQILAAQDDGKNVTRATVLVDIEGFNLLQHLCASCMSVFIRMTAGMETHYPGFWEEIIVVGAPAGSRIGLEAVRPVMSPQTREILKIFDMNKRQWGSYLDERISPDQRTTRYGGTKKINDN
ncbi:SEC14-like protein 2 [Orchesella cincta]|uniref:SEC14-like protein 2 n=1 Tax=Orchesella cincta TaxID=48709 RepID=A0A1D2M0L9_ORCCI|nr:SEC14-like protein 2 [Orchesella cincta]